jgi:threonine/homoserine/homoserine lactone efflux protein
MRNPLRTCIDLWEREGKRAKAKGGWQLFWFSLTCGLIWSIFMVGWLTLTDYLSDGAVSPRRIQNYASFFFVGGMVVGLLLWVSRRASGKRQSPRI